MNTKKALFNDEMRELINKPIPVPKGAIGPRPTFDPSLY